MGFNLNHFNLNQSSPRKWGDYDSVLSSIELGDDKYWYLVIHNSVNIGYVYYNKFTSGLRIFIFTEHRGKGYSKYFYKLILLRHNVSDNKILSVDIRDDNIASIKTHQRLSFVPVENHILVYLKEMDEIDIRAVRYHTTCQKILNLPI